MGDRDETDSANAQTGTQGAPNGTPEGSKVAVEGEKAKRARGAGSLFLRGKVWWIKYHRNGRPYFESCRSPDRGVAEKRLKRRLAQVETGQFRGLQPERVRFDELAADLLNEYAVNRRKSVGRNERSIEHLRDFFAGFRAVDITTDRIRQYVAQRQEASAGNATINRELAALKRMFNLAREMTPPKVQEVPYIPMLKEPPARCGFLRDENYKKLRNQMPGHLRPVFAMAYYTGMRAGEILNLRWEQVDLTERIVRLDPGATKNGEGRTLFLTEELFQLLVILKHTRDAKYADCPWVFFRDGKRIRSYRHGWKSACARAGLTGLRFHDLRRTGVRNLRRAGVTETVAMKISGHKTRSVFDRYNIVDEQDLKEAARKLDALHKFGYSLVTIPPSDEIPAKGKKTVSPLN